MPSLSPALRDLKQRLSCCHFSCNSSEHLPLSSEVLARPLRYTWANARPGSFRRLLLSLTQPLNQKWRISHATPNQRFSQLQHRSDLTLSRRCYERQLSFFWTNTRLLQYWPAPCLARPFHLLPLLLSKSMLSSFRNLGYTPTSHCVVPEPTKCSSVFFPPTHGLVTPRRRIYLQLTCFLPYPTESSLPGRS